MMSEYETSELKKLVEKHGMHNIINSLITCAGWISDEIANNKKSLWLQESGYWWKIRAALKKMELPFDSKFER